MNCDKLRIYILLFFLTGALFVFIASVNKEEEIFVPELTDSISYNFILKDLNLTPKNFDDYKGKVVLINIWATWCGPCRVELPYLQKLYESYAHPDFKIVTIAVDKKGQEDKVKRYLLDNNYTFPVFYPAEKFPKALQVPVIPTSLIIDKNGKVVWQKSGVENFNKPRFKKRIDSLLEL